MQQWEHVVRALDDRDEKLAAVFEHAVPLSVSPERLVLSFRDGSFQADRARDAEAIATLQVVAEAILGATPTVDLRAHAPDAPNAGRTVAAVTSRRRDARAEALRREARQHPVVLAALDVFPEARGRLEIHLDTEPSKT